MRQSGWLLLLLALFVTEGWGDVYQKAGMFVSVFDTVTDYQFGGVGLQYEVGRSSDWGKVGGEFRLGYVGYSDNSNSSYGEDRDCSIVPIELGLKLSKPVGERWAPYISAGVGLYTFRDFSDYDYDDILGYHGAIGCEFYFQKQLGVYLQLKYTKATDDLEGNGFGTHYGIDGLGGDLGVFFRF